MPGHTTTAPIGFWGGYDGRRIPRDLWGGCYIEVWGTDFIFSPTREWGYFTESAFWIGSICPHVSTDPLRIWSSVLFWELISSLVSGVCRSCFAFLASFGTS